MSKPRLRHYQDSVLFFLAASLVVMGVLFSFVESSFTPSNPLQVLPGGAPKDGGLFELNRR